MDMGKYVAVGVLAVIVLAAVTYQAPEQQAQTEAQATETVEGTFGGTAATQQATPVYESPIRHPGLQAKTPKTKAESALPNKPQNTAGDQILKYTVKAGQTLADVAKDMLGDAKRWKELYECNKDRIGPDPNQIRKGMVLVWKKVETAIAKVASMRRSASATTTTLAASTPRGRSHIVVRGDTLYRIAAQYLGKGSRYKEIMDLNNLSSGSLRVGQRISLPTK